MEASPLPQPATGEPRIAIKLHIVSPSLPPPHRLTFDDTSLSTTIAELKKRIEKAFPGNPPTSTQRLIYRGKPLRSDDAVLGSVISKVEGSNDTDSVHLALTPGPISVSSGIPQPSLAGRLATQSQTQSSSSVGGLNTHFSTTASSMSSIPSLAKPSNGNDTPSYTTFNQPINNLSSGRLRTTFQVPQVDAVEFSRQVRVIRGQIEQIERQLDQSLMPSMETIIRIRTQLLEIQDTRYERRLPAPGTAELVARVFDAQQRARLLDTMLQRPSQTGTPTQTSVSHDSNNSSTTNSPQYFMLSSPSGEQSILITPNAINPQLPPIQPTIPTRITPGEDLAAFQINHPEAALRDVARQMMQNHQPPRANNIEHFGLARHIRRIWLFTRLWFFCYLTSAPGTWRRYIFVSIALLITFLSETDVPQQLWQLIVVPAQRHLEGLTHAGGPLDPTARVANMAPGFGVWDQIRRVERSVVLLVASLIPGLGERQVQVRHAAEQERERERVEQARVDAGQEQVDGDARETRENAEQTVSQAQSDQAGSTEGSNSSEADTVDASAPNIQAEHSSTH